MELCKLTVGCLKGDYGNVWEFLNFFSVHVVLLPFPECITVNETKRQHFLGFSFGFLHICRCVRDICVVIILATQVSRLVKEIIPAWPNGETCSEWPSSWCYVNQSSEWNKFLFSCGHR